MTYLERAIQDGHAVFIGDGKQRKIKYVAMNHTEKYSDPEEQVRAEFWAELIYRYEYSTYRIGIEVTIPDRTPKDRADIIIFHDDEHKKPYAVIECKKEDITDTEFNQAVEQVVGNASWQKMRADYVMVVAGMTRRAFDFSGDMPIGERSRNIIADLPFAYGKPLEFKYHKGVKNADIEEVTQDELMSAIRKSHQTLWGAGKFSPPQAFSELCKIIFIKMSDEKKPRDIGEPYQFQIKTYETNQQLATRIHALYNQERERDPNVFTEGIRVDDDMLTQVVSHLESINLHRTDLDTKGVAFEQFMDGFFKGNFGQYFTPRTIIEFIVDIMQPTYKDKVIDPACGSGGFLLHALNAVRKEADRYYPDPNSRDNFAHWHTFATNKLYGIEINDDIARVAKMNMIIHDDGHTNVIRADALEHQDMLMKDSQNYNFNNYSFDLVLTNPPFGGEPINLGSRKHLVDDYDLAAIYDKKGNETPRKNQKPEILFIERIWHFLKKGTGRAAVILPDGILSNSSLQYVRDWMIDHFQINAVISLPQFAFAPYGAGVKASILFLRKRAEKEQPNPDEPIFMASPQHIGYDATGRKTKQNNLLEVKDAYKKYFNPLNGLSENIQSNNIYTVLLADVQKDSRLDAGFYHPQYTHYSKTLDKLSIPKVKISQLSPQIIGGATPERDNDNLYTTEGIKLLRIMNIAPYEIDLTDVKYITEDVHNGLLARSQLKVGDVLMTITGRVGTCAVVREDILPANINQHIVILRINNDLCLTDYFVAYMNGEMGKALSNRPTTGGTRIALDYQAIGNLEIPLPSIDIQKMLVEELHKAKNRVQELRQKADNLWAEAQNSFEKSILS